MKPKPAKSLRRERLLSIVTRYFERETQACSLVEEFLGTESYDKALCKKLIEVGRGKTGALGESSGPICR